MPESTSSKVLKTLLGAAICFGLCGWGISSCRKSEPPAAPPIIQPRATEPDAAGIEFVREHYRQLLAFKDHDSFKTFGFGKGGPHHQWLTDVQAENAKSYSPRIGVVIGDLLNLGIAYVASRGVETKQTSFSRGEIEKAIK